jgi:hypothetical protein
MRRKKEREEEEEGNVPSVAEANSARFMRLAFNRIS